MVSWQVGNITLPYSPYKISCKNTANLKDYISPGDLPLILSFGKKGRVLTLEGTLYIKGQNIEYLDTIYITPITAYVGTIVGVVGPGTRYDGNWFVSAFDIVEDKGTNIYVTYKLELLQGSTMFEIQTKVRASP